MKFLICATLVSQISCREGCAAEIFEGFQNSQGKKGNNEQDTFKHRKDAQIARDKYTPRKIAELNFKIKIRQASFA